MPEGHDVREDGVGKSRLLSRVGRRKAAPDPDDERYMEPADRYLWYLVPFVAVWAVGIAAVVYYFA